MSVAAINGRDVHGWTALHRACFKGKIEVTRTLFEKGVDMVAKDEDGYTALHCAVDSRHANVIEMLVKKGVDAEARINKGVTALQIAKSLHYVVITKILSHRGATKGCDIHTPIFTSPTPFWISAVGSDELKKI